MKDKTSSKIADYGLIGNMQSAALVSRDGVIDWFCPGRFDSPACFAALLGSKENGFWAIAPCADEPSATGIKTSRTYVKDTLVLRTLFETPTGQVELLDYMPVHQGCHVVREVRGLKGHVAMNMTCVPRFYYGKNKALVTAQQDALEFKGDLDNQEHLLLIGDLPMQINAEEGSGYAHWEVSAGECFHWVLSHSDGSEIAHIDNVDSASEDCIRWWRDWVAQCTYTGPCRDAVVRSLIVLKAMIFDATGAMVAAPTTSLPEIPGGEANWDYRFTWIRDAALVLDVLVQNGFQQEACAWRNWLLDAVAETDGELHPVYTLDGKTLPPEQELNWLAGYQGAQPVRISNEARNLHQLDLRGEIAQAFHIARKTGLKVEPRVWDLQCDMLDKLAQEWQGQDTGIWESRESPKDYVHSKLFAWVAFDRSIADAEAYGLDGPVDHWRKLREEIFEDIVAKGIHPEKNHFVRSYGSREIDPSLLMIPLVGFLPVDDERVVATVKEIEAQLTSEQGFVYRNPPDLDHGLEGVFIPCCYWLTSYYASAGRKQQAEELFTRLLNSRNDLGLMAEELNVDTGEFLGNFPQTFSHLELINSAHLIFAHEKDERSE